MSHIHIAPEGKDSPVAAWLYPPGPPPQPKEGKPLSALIGKMEAGEAYVNVHTKQMPGGEVRGQIKAR
jgi:hypothetical protein